MICDVCGRNNADNLTFCQDCGRRLRQQRGVAPTPPNGMPRIELPAAPAPPLHDADADGGGYAPRPPPSRPAAPAAQAPQQLEASPESNRGSSPSGPPSAGRRARPAAPIFSFSPQGAPDQAVEPRATPAPVRPVPNGGAAGRAPATVTCTECGSANPPEYRFCVTCGASLKRAAPEEPAAERRAAPQTFPTPAPLVGPPPLPPPSPAPAPVVAAPAEGGDKIVGAPVVDIAASGAVPAKIVTCARCHGHCVAGTRFCKYCGAPLDEAPQARAQAPSASPHVPPAAGAPRHNVPPVADARRAADGVGKVPLPPIGGPAHDDRVHEGGSGPRPGARRPVAASFDSGVRPAVNPPTPLPGQVTTGTAPHDAGSSSAAAAPPNPQPPRPAMPRPAPVEPAPRPVLARSAPAAPAPRPIPNAPVAPPHPRIEDLTGDSELGVRSEISELAGSPIPAEPLIPSPPPVHDHSPPTARVVPGRWKGGRLVVIVEDGSEGRSFSLAEGQLDVGRTDGDIVLEDDPYVSPRHARLRRLDTGWALRDLDSTNHVYVRLRKPHPMRDGDLLLLGLEVLQFQTVSDGERGLGHAIQHGTFLFGSPATPRRARLCQRTVEGVIRDVYHLFRDETIIGREVGDIVFTADPFLSRRHASIRRNPVTSEFALVDLDSSNGTYVAIRGEVAISDGDFLRIGQHLFRVDLG